MVETIKDCRCIDRDDKHELSKAVLARIELYKKLSENIEIVQIIQKAETLKKGEIEIKPTREIRQYKEIINRLENLHKRLENTPVC